MSGECLGCGEHCLDCECANEINEIEDNLNNMITAYQYVGKKDRHLIRILHWIKILENLHDEVRQTDRDKELEKEIESIINRLTNEVGVRMTMVFPLS